MRRNNKKATLL